MFTTQSPSPYTPSYTPSTLGTPQPPAPPPKPASHSTPPAPSPHPTNISSHATNQYISSLQPNLQTQNAQGPQVLGSQAASRQHPWHSYAEGQHQQGHGQYQQQSPQSTDAAHQVPGQGQQQQQQIAVQHNTSMPEDGWVPDALSEKSQPDLQHALTHPEILKALLHSSSTAPLAMTSSTVPLEQLLHTNIGLAQHVRALYNTLISERERVSTHLLAVRALEQQWRKKQTELEHRLEPWGPRELHQRLGASIIDAERLCMGVEENFLEDGSRTDGDVASEREAADWVKRVREGRKLVALRRERRARWDEGRVGGWR